MRMLVLLLLALSARAESQDLQLARTEEWARLLHYKRHWLGGWKSAVDGSGFFLSAEGRRNPEAELRATLSALEQGGGAYGRLKQSAYCAFPARRAFLERAGKKYRPEPCPQKEEWLARLDPDSLTLVFATAYPGNPASMFGHSFLKVRGRQEGGEVLDWSLNYAAVVPDDENGFAFAWFGLTGGYIGQFALVPYYAKIEEYGNSEGRDLWEYDLALSREESLRLLDAIWELETNAHFDYFFFDENCSHKVLTLLEIARRDWHLSGYFLHLIPGESVRTVALEPGAVKAVRMRPSLTRRLRATVESLSLADRDAFDAARREGSLEIAPAALHAYALFLQAEKQRKKEKWTGGDEARFRETLRARANAPSPGRAPENGGERTRPDLAHGSYRIGLGPVGSRFRGVWQGGGELSLRAAYHDLLDPDPGFMPHSEIHFPNFRLRFQDETLMLDELEFLSLVSLTPWDLVRKPIAWRARLAYQRFADLDCERCRGLRLEGGPGAALAVRPETWTLWAFLGSSFDGASALPRSVRLSFWSELGTLFTFSSEAKFLFTSRAVWSGVSGTPWHVELKGGMNQPLSQEWGARVEGETVLPLRKGSASSDVRLHAVRYF